MRSPSGVSIARGRSRRKRSPPSSPSRSLIARVSDGCATWHSSAARVKFSVRATAKKYRTWCISMRTSPGTITTVGCFQPAFDDLVRSSDRSILWLYRPWTLQQGYGAYVVNSAELWTPGGEGLEGNDNICGKQDSEALSEIEVRKSLHSAADRLCDRAPIHQHGQKLVC